MKRGERTSLDLQLFAATPDYLGQDSQLLVYIHSQALIVQSTKMRGTPSLSFTSSQRVFARRPNSFNPSKDGLDIANLVGPGAAPFDFPLTRPTLLKMEKQRKILHYLRLEQLQFKDLGKSNLYSALHTVLIARVLRGAS